MLRALALRGVDGGSAALRRPVRVLLLERTNTGDWLDTIIGRTNRSKLVEQLRARPDFALDPASDPWLLISHILNEKAIQLPDKSDVLSCLSEIDPESRSLYAFFVADAIAAGRDVHELDGLRLVLDVIEREREAFWRPAGATLAEERLLALATMTGGIPRAALSELDTSQGLLPKWNFDLHPVAFQIMTGKPANEHVPPLQPDIVGAHFVSSVLGSQRFSQTDRAHFCNLAWQTSGRGMLQFALRAHRDIPSSSLLASLRLPPTEGTNARHAFSEFCVGVTAVLALLSMAETLRLLDDLRRLREQRTEEQILRENWARMAHNVVGHLCKTDLGRALELHGEIRSFMDLHDELELREMWAGAAANVVHALRDENPIAALDLLRELRILVDLHDGPNLRMFWSMGALNVILFYCAKRISGQRLLFTLK